MLNGRALPPGMTRAIESGGAGEPAMSPQLKAFLAAERANRPAEAAAGLSEVASRSPIRSTSSPAVVAGGQPRSMLLAYVLWWFFGGFAAHRFYLGQVTSAVAMTCTMIGSFAMMFILPPVGVVGFLFWALWLFADVFLIPGMTRRYNDALRPAADVFA